MRSGAGRDTSGALHHSCLDGLEVEEDLWSSALDAENVIQDNACQSQITIVPESGPYLICELQYADGYAGF